MSVRPRTTNADGSAVCPHRDVSVCRDCAKDERYVEVWGAHWWMPDPADRALWAIELAEITKENQS